MALDRKTRERAAKAATLGAAADALGSMIACDAVLKSEESLERVSVTKSPNTATWEIRLSLVECGDEVAAQLRDALLAPGGRKKVRLYFDPADSLRLAQMLKDKKKLGSGGVVPSAFHDWSIAMTHLPELEGVNWRHDFTLKEANLIYKIADPTDNAGLETWVQNVGMSDYQWKQLRKKKAYQKAVDMLSDYFLKELKGLTFQALTRNLSGEAVSTGDIRLAAELMGLLKKEKGGDINVNINTIEAAEQLRNQLTPENRKELADMMALKANVTAVGEDGRLVEGTE
jgi:hypothetical protein